MLLKVHQVVYDAVQQACRRLRLPGAQQGPDQPGRSRVTDLLVTDYSSIFFDFLATGRPVVHYVPDLDDYRSGRGLYLAETDLPGPVCAHHARARRRRRQRASGAGPSDRSADLAPGLQPQGRRVGLRAARRHRLPRRDEEPYTVHRDFGTDKETPADLPRQPQDAGHHHLGAQPAAQPRLRQLRRHRVLHLLQGRGTGSRTPPSSTRERGSSRARSSSTARRRGSASETKKLMEHGLPEQLSADHVKFWTDEWQRVFGHAKFDHLIDFSGYGCYSPFLFSVTEAKHKSIWLHNDMYADMQRETVGEKHLEDRLQAVFTTYKYFDHLVSVSPALEAINRTSLADFAPPERFTHAVNTIDGERILGLSGLTAAQAAAKADGGDVEPSGPRARVEIDIDQPHLGDVGAAGPLRRRGRAPRGPRAASARQPAGSDRWHRHVRDDRSALAAEEPRPDDQGVRHRARAQPAHPAGDHGLRPARAGAPGAHQQPGHGVGDHPGRPGRQPLSRFSRRATASCCPATTRVSPW